MLSLRIIPLILLLSGCSERNDLPTGGQPSTSSTAEGFTAALPNKMSIKTEDDSVLAKLTRQENNLELRDANDASIGEIKVQKDRVKLKGVDGEVHWKLKQKDYGVEIEDDAGNRLYRIRWKVDEWRLEDRDEKVIAAAKLKENGDFELRDATGKSLAKAKRRDGKIAVETEAGERIVDLTDCDEPLAAVWLALGDSFSLAERSSIVVYFLAVHQG